MLETILWTAAQPLYDLSINIAGGLLTNLFQKLLDKDKQKLQADLDEILKIFSPAAQKAFKKLSAPQKQMFLALLLPLVVNQENPDNLAFLKRLLLSTLPVNFPARDDFVHSFVTITLAHFQQKSDPYLQAKIGKVQNDISLLGETMTLQDQKVEQMMARLNKLATLEDIRNLLLELAPAPLQAKVRERHLYLTIHQSNGAYHCTLQDDQGERLSQPTINPFADMHFGVCLQRIRKGEFPLPTKEAAVKQQKLLEYEEQFRYVAQKLYDLLFPTRIASRIKAHLEDLRQRKIDHLFLNLHSKDFHLLNLPFELAYHLETGYFFQRERIYLSRTLLSSEDYFAGQTAVPLAPPPLRILVAVSAPDDLPERQQMLDFEKEQELIIQALDPLTSKELAQVDFTVGGSLAEIESLLEQEPYHVLHLSGHGTFDGNMGYFVLEDEQGRKKQASARELAEKLKDFTSLQLVFLSGCQTAEFTNYEEMNGVAQCLSHEGIPFVIGMQRSVSDAGATQFSQYFYQQLAYERSIDEALYLARKKMKDAEEQALKEGRQDVVPYEWAIPVLYRTGRQAQIIDFDQPPRQRKLEQAPPELDFRGIHVVKTGFVGRRKEMRQFYRLFHAHNKAICLRGYGGIGKSSLATRLAKELHQRSGYHVFGFVGTVSPEVILSELAALAGKIINPEAQAYIMDPQADESTKLQRLLAILLTKQKLLVLFDNFENNQYEDGTIIQPPLQNWLQQMIQGLSDSSLLVFTTRYQLAQLPLKEISLGEFSFVDTWKKMDRLELLRSLETRLKRDIHYEIGGHPHALELLDSILSETEMQWQAIKAKLEQVKQKEQYEDLLLDILWENLTPEEQHLLQWISLFRAPIAQAEFQKVYGAKLNGSM